MEAVPEFQSFSSISRLYREVVVTEKIDGTNACVHVLDDGRVLAASRTRYITPEDDNFGFAAWVKAHESELRNGLGIGRHYGEWWGAGIQRRYGLTDKRFSLFNTGRWGEGFGPQGADPRVPPTALVMPPSCCLVVPVLYRGVFDSERVEHCLIDLTIDGSRAAPGFANPEGVVVYHTAGNLYFKSTLPDDGHKHAGRATDFASNFEARK